MIFILEQVVLLQILNYLMGKLACMLNVANHNVKRAFELLDHFDQEKYEHL